MTETGSKFGHRTLKPHLVLLLLLVLALALVLVLFSRCVEVLQLHKDTAVVFVCCCNALACPGC